MAADLILAALRHVWLTLAPLNLPVAVLGGLALAAWKYVRATQDIDLLLAVGPDEIPRVLQVLQSAGIQPKRKPPILGLGQFDLVQLLYSPPGSFVDVQIDLLIGKKAYHQVAMQRRVAMQLPGLDVGVQVLSCEDLILHKLAAGRLIDRADVVALLRANRRSMDLDYVAKWSDELGLTAAWQEAWRAVFPELPVPKRAAPR